ncbi:MAG: type II toxin-antitoxin system VapC family toxin [Candidatus Bathyarchaeota archaeon]|nr:type II toxin-antitoxin system VapC family toxin [Candidatus Bathyarchaeota archaeon]MDD4325319.1 type II toxin-antitoxin system VapC family toxin [Candidatus Bathyarchaeota archaeon]MDI9578692.1 type II toxin-antitoxin system VapC family toxin [Thermoproteota archaeon]MDT8782570.1 type II toxin-antitoxin system VapC family toxin [Candidatus Bathyarchaeota archaeon]NLD65516.1 type II toxin-antitoxin system VapC family toxin [Thermoproteota archaeon]
MTSKQLGKKCKYLIDTSALYPLLISGQPFNTDECAVSSLTQYEVGNVLWRENKQKKLKDPARVATIFSEALSPLRVLKIDSLANVLALAIERNLTFYDASYAYLAEKENLSLVTQDIELLKKCRDAITIKEMK